MSLVGFALTDTVAHATDFAVTIMADGGAGSLRDAIRQANANPGPDTITVPVGTYTLSIAGRDEDANLTGDLDITGPTTIIGAGAGLTIIDAAGIDRVFDIIGGPTELQGMTITNGAPAVVVPADGGNIREGYYVDLTVQDAIISNGNATYGGGISGDRGLLTILRTELRGNSVTSYLGNSGVGGAIKKGGGSQGSLVLTDSSLTDNHADDGVGIMVIDSGLTATNSTIANNFSYSRTVLLEASGSSNFAAILDHVTIANNKTVSLGGGGAGLTVNLIFPAVMPVTVAGSLFVNNVTDAASSNCVLIGNGVPAITSGGHNLSDDTTCAGFTKPDDLNNNQLTTLGAIANNGGPTRTLALGVGSSALDAAGACGGLTPTDQRGVSRPQGIACDIGAFEAAVNVVTSTTQAPTTQAPTTQAPTTVAPGSTLAEPPTSPDSGVVGATTVPPMATFPTFTGGQLPSTGNSHSGTLWLAMLACSLGGLLMVTARRLAR